MEKSKKGLNKDTVQVLRKVSQFAFLGLLVAGMYMNMRMVIMVLFPASLIFGNFFCGWVCPYGTLQELMGSLGRKLFKKQYKMPRSIQKYMQYTRYILFGILTIGVLDFILTPLNGYGTLMGLFSEEAMEALSTFTIGIMVFYLLLAIVFERPFCNYLCTEAAKHGIASMTRVFSIKREEDKCVSCKKCDAVCPMNIEVSIHDQVRNGQCINCMKCIQACPVDGTLAYTKVKWPIGKNKNK